MLTWFLELSAPKMIGVLVGGVIVCLGLWYGIIQGIAYALHAICR